MAQDPKYRLNQNWLRYGSATGGIAFLTILCEPFRTQISSTSVALLFLLVVLFTATFFGRNPALLSAFVGVLSFNYFFLQPYGTFIIADQQNWIAWVVFMVTAIVAGELSAYARRRAEEAEISKQKVEALYAKLQSAFERSSKIEAIRQSEKLKSALLDAVTHDLRTPLTSIKAAVTSLIDDGKTDTLEFKLDNEGKQEFLEIINEETDRLNRFIEGMVELARVEAGMMQQNRSWNGVETIIQTALERAAIRLKNHQVKLVIEPNLPAIRVDAKSIEEVLYTLLDNAAKYAEHNTTITIIARYASDEMIKISVADEGRGIPLEMREKVFERFFRADLEKKNKKQGDGVGLGLAIAHGIVESHGGRIWILDGAAGRGTRIIFTVPIDNKE